MELMNIESCNQITMTSREIAEVTGKQHQHVKRDIEKMLAELGEDVSKYGHIYFDSMNRQQNECRLDRDLTENLLMGYSATLRRKVLSYMRKLEDELRVRAVPGHAIPQTLSEALRLAADLNDKVQHQQGQIADMTPKVEFHDKFVNADGLYGLQNGGRALNCRPNLFIRWLKEIFVFYQGGNLVPRIRYTQMGIFEVKTTIVDDKARPQAYITPKGLEYLAKRLPEHILVSAK